MSDNKCPKNFVLERCLCCSKWIKIIAIYKEIESDLLSDIKELSEKNKTLEKQVK